MNDEKFQQAKQTTNQENKVLFGGVQGPFTVNGNVSSLFSFNLNFALMHC